MKNYKPTILLALIFLLSYTVSYSKTYTWEGGYSDNFNDAGNWSPAPSPSILPGDTVIFDEGTISVNVPTNFSSSAMTLGAVFVKDGVSVMFINSGSNPVNFYIEDLIIEPDCELILGGTGGISIYITNNADISGTLNTENINYIETSGTMSEINFINSAILITANPGGYTGSIHGSSFFDENFQIIYNGTGNQDTGFDSDCIIGSITVNNASGVILNRNLETDNINLFSGTFDIKGYTLTVNEDFYCDNGITATDINTQLIFNDNGNAPDTIHVTFDDTDSEIGNLEINRSGKIVVFDSDTEVNDLNLQAGKLKLDADMGLNNVTNNNNSSYIITSPWSYVSMQNMQEYNSYYIPLGTGNFYSPITVTPGSTIYSDFMINVQDSVYSEGYAGIPLNNKNINVSWEIFPGGDNYDLTLGWQAGAEGSNFNSGNCHISHFDGDEWDNFTDNPATEDNGIYTVSRSFSGGEEGYFSVFSGINTPPDALDNIVITSVNTNYIFHEGDFGYTDPDNDELAKIQITQIPDKGTLFNDLNDNDIPESEEILTVGSLIYVNDISNGHFKFAPDPDETGSPYTDFAFKVSDGMNYSNSEYVITVEVTDNHPPVAYNQTFTIPEHSPEGTVAGTIEAYDPDGDNIFFYPEENADYSDAFSLSDNGTVTVNNSALLEYSVNPSFEYNINVCDDGEPELCTEITVTINLEEITVEVIPANFISPNGDGYNDRWFVQGLENDTFEAFILNNNGKILFRSSDYHNEWDGTSKGKELPPGIYYYLLKSPNIELKGTVTLIR